jgi:hypothetical protein
MRLFQSEAEVLRDEQERVARTRPWLAFSRYEPPEPKPAERDHFTWRNAAELFEEQPK